MERRSLMSGVPQLGSSKLLGVSVMSDSTGETQHNAVVYIIKDWDVLPQVIAMVFETTSSSIGSFKGSATCLEKSRACANSMVCLYAPRF